MKTTLLLLSLVAILWFLHRSQYQVLFKLSGNYKEHPLRCWGMKDEMDDLYDDMGDEDEAVDHTLGITLIIDITWDDRNHKEKSRVFIKGPNIWGGALVKNRIQIYSKWTTKKTCWITTLSITSWIMRRRIKEKRCLSRDQTIWVWANYDCRDRATWFCRTKSRLVSRAIATGYDSWNEGGQSGD